MEMDCILWLDGWVIFWDKKEILVKVVEIVKLFYWDVILIFNKENEEFFVV